MIAVFFVHSKLIKQKTKYNIYMTVQISGQLNGIIKRLILRSTVVVKLKEWAFESISWWKMEPVRDDSFNFLIDEIHDNVDDKLTLS